MEKLTNTQSQKVSLVLLRLLIGWHFLYEGVIKMYNPSWTAKGYLSGAEFLKPVFTAMAHDNVISIIDTLNIVGLFVVGITLLLGIKEKWGCIAGIALLSLYYLAHPPFSGITQGPAEGSYWIVNKNLIEIAALYVLLLFPTAYYFGLESLFNRKKIETSPAPL